MKLELFSDKRHFTFFGRKRGWSLTNTFHQGIKEVSPLERGCYNSTFLPLWGLHYTHPWLRKFSSEAISSQRATSTHAHLSQCFLRDRKFNTKLNICTV